MTTRKKPSCFFICIWDIASVRIEGPYETQDIAQVTWDDMDKEGIEAAAILGPIPVAKKLMVPDPE